MGKTQGIGLKVALWMYKVVLLPKILFASVVWWPMVGRVAAMYLLQSLPGSY
jgi:hypothetical protein